MISKFDKKILDEYARHTSISVEKHPSEELYIYGYHSNLEKSNLIWDDHNIHCRGLIIDLEGNIVARPFPKFFTYRKYIDSETLQLSEGQLFKLPKTKFKILEKVDGTMCTLYWIKDKPFLATQRSFMNPNAIKATEILYEKYAHTFEKFNKQYTYVFEAIFPETNVLIDYGNQNELVLIGILDNVSGNSLPLEDLGFKTAIDYTDTYKDIENFEALRNLNLSNQEGFVILFDNGERIKLKFPWYQEVHKLHTDLVTAERRVYEISLKLSSSLNHPVNRISNLYVWECLKNRKTNREIFFGVPDVLFSVGVEVWIKDMMSCFNDEFLALKNDNTGLSDSELWRMLKPTEIVFFNFREKLVDTKFSTPMWNRMIKLKHRLY
jgi:hypothetical protein